MISLTFMKISISRYYIIPLHFVQFRSSYPTTICSKRMITHYQYVRQFSCQMQHVRVFGIMIWWRCRNILDDLMHSWCVFGNDIIDFQIETNILWQKESTPTRNARRCWPRWQPAAPSKPLRSASTSLRVQSGRISDLSHTQSATE